MYTNTFYPDPVNFVATLIGLPVVLVGIGIAVLALWTIVWKGLGLWNAARDGQKWWFLAFLIINDLGILEIIYLVWFRQSARNKMPSLFDQPTTPSAAESSVTEDPR